MERRADLIIIAFLFIAILTACSGGGGGGVVGPPATLTSIAISPAAPAMAPGTTTQLKAIGTYSNNSSAILTSSVTWTSSNAGLATVSNAHGSQGLVTSISSTATGTTTITATLGGIPGSTVLTVAHVASISVTPPAPPSIAPGTGLQYAAIGVLSNTTNTQNLTSFATWTSSDSAISSVSDTAGSKGFAIAVSPGTSITATATITALYDGQSGTASFQTSSLSSIMTSPSITSIPKGTTQQFAAEGTLADGTPQTVTAFATWSSFSTGVATISNTGLATAVSQGTTTIAASFSNVTSSPPAVLTVTAPVLSSITVTPVNPSSVLGKTEQFVALGTFTDQSILDISSLATWNSSDSSVATISNTSGSKGLVTSVKTGTTTITATSGSISGSTTLTVIPAVLQSIVISPANVSISISTNIIVQQFTAIGHFSDGNTQDLTTFVTWNSSNTNAATISNTTGSQGRATVSFINIPSSTNITATFSGITSNTAVLSVNF